MTTTTIRTNTDETIIEELAHFADSCAKSQTKILEALAEMTYRRKPIHTSTLQNVEHAQNAARAGSKLADFLADNYASDADRIADVLDFALEFAQFANTNEERVAWARIAQIATGRTFHMNRTRAIRD